MARVDSVMVAEVWVDGEHHWSGAYPNATKRQALSYAQNSAVARGFLEKGVRIELKARRFDPTGEVEECSVVPEGVS